jgi:hypothetical protein
MSLPHSVYVIVRNVWNDNSEICYPPDDGGGIPETAYFSEEKAEAACAKLNDEAKLAAILSSHAYDIYDVITNATRWRGIIQTYALPDAGEGDWYTIGELDIPDNIKKEMIDCLCLTFYEVYQVPLEQWLPPPDIQEYNEEDRFKELDI